VASGTTSQNHSYVFDPGMEFKDAGLIAADAAALVDTVAKIVDLGANFLRAAMVIDISAVEIASNDERYDIVIQLSNSATFASGILDRCALTTGTLEALAGDTDTPVGRHILYFDNEIDGTIYRYARVWTDVTGTIATGINYTAWAAPF
jgi:hypothetical protein